jgi:hypothetical protein
MTAHNTPDPVFNALANAAETARQVSVSTASGTGAVLQNNVRLSEITYYRAIYSAALKTTISPASASLALRALGVQT